VAVRVLAIGSVGIALAPALAEAAGVRSSSGLRGVVMRGLTTPVCRDDEPCEAPAGDLVLQFRRDGRIEAQVTTTQTGTYLVRLRPGEYVVTTPASPPGRQLTPRVVRVPRGGVGRVDLHLDSGLQ
jgi:hypothetical protein